MFLSSQEASKVREAVNHANKYTLPNSKELRIAKALKSLGHDTEAARNHAHACFDAKSVVHAVRRFVEENAVKGGE